MSSDGERSPAALRAAQLSLAYEGRVVVDGLELAITPGHITTLIGPNGCGKSTILRGLGRLLAPKSGAVYLDGVAIATLPTRQIAQRLGILPQTPTAPAGLTVKDLVAQGRYPHQTWWQQWSAIDEAMVNEAIAVTQLETLCDRPLQTLSGGQRQRAWIAMALAQDTDILLLDEPTTYLDLAHQLDLLDLLQQLNRTLGRTIVMVLHDLNLASRYADHLIAIHNGTLYAQGPPATVITPTLLRDVFGLDCTIIPDPVTNTPLCIPIRAHAPDRALS